MNDSVANGLGDLVAQIPNPPEWLNEALAVPREQGFVDVDGCPINYFRWGDRSKPPILMTHGFLAHARCFAFIAPFLANDYHLVAFDMSGMGDSGWHDRYSEETRIKELIAVAEATGMFDHELKPTIIAHSFGSMVSTAAMYEHADKFSGLIVCDLMIYRPSTLEQHKELMGPPGGRADRGDKNNIYPDYETARSRFRLAPPQAVNVPVLMDFMAYHSLKQVDGGWTWKFDPSVFKAFTAESHDRWIYSGKRVAENPARTAIIHGEQSKLFIPDSVAYMHELRDKLGLPRLPIIGVDNAQHHLMLDQPLAFVSALKSVLEFWK